MWGICLYGESTGGHGATAVPGSPLAWYDILEGKKYGIDPLPGSPVAQLGRVDRQRRSLWRRGLGLAAISPDSLPCRWTVAINRCESPLRPVQTRTAACICTNEIPRQI